MDLVEQSVFDNLRHEAVNSLNGGLAPETVRETFRDTDVYH